MPLATPISLASAAATSAALFLTLPARRGSYCCTFCCAPAFFGHLLHTPSITRPWERELQGRFGVTLGLLFVFVLQQGFSGPLRRILL